MEVIGWFTIAAMLGIAAMVAITRVEATVHMAVEAAIAVIVTACADENATVKPFRAIVAIGSAVVGAIAIVSVRADRWSTDTNAN